MTLKLDASPRIGEYITSEIDGRSVRAYLPVELPFDPPPVLDPESQELLQQAYLAIGKLDGTISALPDRNLLLHMYLRKEAVLSSQIEGTEESLETFLNIEGEQADAASADDVREVSNYVSALEFGIEQLETEELSIRLIEELHGILLSSGRGSKSDPGRIRTRQNVIGAGSRLRYVPPPDSALSRLLENLLGFINGHKPAGGVLVNCAIAHVQFESIHPFMDGNGRIGRLLINLQLFNQGLLHYPLLFLSLYLKAHRQEYYSLLNDVREHGDWESWIKFFLAAVMETAGSAADCAFEVASMIEQDRSRLSDLGKQEGSARQLYETMLRHPIATVPVLARISGLSQPTARMVLETFVTKGLCDEITGGQRNRTYRYSRYLALLNSGTELTT